MATGTTAPIDDRSPSQHVDLPQVPAAHMEQRSERELSGLADAFLQVFQLGEFLRKFGTGWRIEAAAPHHQHSLRPDGQFGMKPNQADHIDDNLTAELLLQRLEIVADFRLRDVAARDDVKKLQVSVKSHPQPFPRG